jgi:hypothetical protein
MGKEFLLVPLLNVGNERLSAGKEKMASEFRKIPWETATFCVCLAKSCVLPVIIRVLSPPPVASLCGGYEKFCCYSRLPEVVQMRVSE